MQTLQATLRSVEGSDLTWFRATSEAKDRHGTYRRGEHVADHCGSLLDKATSVPPDRGAARAPECGGEPGAVDGIGGGGESHR